MHGDLIAGPPAGTATGGSPNTVNRLTGNLFVRILGGSGAGDYLAVGAYQEATVFNIDGTVRDFVPTFNKTERNGASVQLGGGSGLSANVTLPMPELVIDPGAKLQVSCMMGGDASDSSTTDAYNTWRLSFTLPEGVTLANDAGQALAWVGNAAPVPEPGAFSLIALGLAATAAFARRSAS